MKVILGAGISGLAAGYYLRRKFPREVIKILESSSEVGGWIKSTRFPNGVVFEQGPRTLRPKNESGYNTLQLIDAIGLSDKIKPIHSTHPAAKKRMIYVNGKLHILPSSFIEIFKTLSPFSKPLIAHILNDLVTKSQKVGKDESIYNFVERRFGKEIAQYAISPLICGICAGDAKEISVKFLMKSLFENEQKYGSVIKGVIYDFIKNGVPKTKKTSLASLTNIARNEKWSIYSFEGGMDIFPYTLKEKLKEKNVHIELNQTCNKLIFGDHSVEITLKDGNKINANHVISSLPAKILANLVKEQHPGLFVNLEKIHCVDVAVINLQFKKDFNLEDAFGFLVPPSEKLPILGVIFDSCCFPNSENIVLTVMMGGHWFEQLFGKNPTEAYLLEIALKEIKRVLKIQSAPINYKVNILRDCIPQYVVGHNDVVNNIERYISKHKIPLSICGSSYYGVGVNDVILSAKKAVNLL